MPLLNMRRMTDEERYQIQGSPTHCIECGKELVFKRLQTGKGTIVQVYCKDYSKNPDLHEWFRWEETSSGRD